MKNREKFGGTPLIIAASAPLVLVSKNNRDKWQPTLDDINFYRYDYLKLNRITGGIHGNVPPYAMLVGFDGTLALPDLPDFSHHEKALKIFNRVFLEMLLGGIYKEAAKPSDICKGVLLKSRYIRMYPSRGQTSALHFALRDRTGSINDNIELMDLKPVTLETLKKAVSTGREILDKCSTLSPEVVLAGISHYVAGALPESLTCLWTGIEQLISAIWREEIEIKAQVDSIPGRSQFLKDFRAWTTSTRIELLFQKSIIGTEIYACLNEARKSRNDFVHNGIQPKLPKVTSALQSFFYLLSSFHTDYNDNHTFNDIFQNITSRCILIPRLRNEEESKFDPKDGYFRETTPLPGEAGFKGKYKKVKLNMKPITEIDPEFVKKISRYT